MDGITNNIGKLVNGPIPWMMMGPIANRPATSDLNAVYISTDEGSAGKWKVYWYSAAGWVQFKGVSTN